MEHERGRLGSPPPDLAVWAVPKTWAKTGRTNLVHVAPEATGPGRCAERRRMPPGVPLPKLVPMQSLASPLFDLLGAARRTPAPKRTTRVVSPSAGMRPPCLARPTTSRGR